MDAIHLATTQAAYLLLPLIGSVICAAVILVLGLWPSLKRPLDGGATFRGRRVFGDNKTWRGVVGAWVGCVASVALQKYVIADWAGDLAVIDYESVSLFALGTVFTVGAVVGELPNSFVKRQIGIAPGGRPTGLLVPVFYTWDQIDALFVLWPLLLFWVRPGASLLIASFAVVFVAHQIVSLVGRLIGARRSSYW
jgi:CDP-diglyceride synthetase